MKREPRDGKELLAAPNQALVLTLRPNPFLLICPPNPFLVLWRWRYELAVAAAIPLALSWLTSTVGANTTVAIISVVTALLFGWPPARRRILALAWCVITPHRFRLACAQARVHTRSGRLPAVLWCAHKSYGEQLLVWCPAGITAADLHAARAVIAAACFATDVQVVAHPTRRQLVVVAMIRRMDERQGRTVQPHPRRRMGLRRRPARSGVVNYGFADGAASRRDADQDSVGPCEP